MPVLHDALGGQIQHPAQGVVVREGRLILCDLPELAVQTLDDVRRVYDFPNLNGVFEEMCLKPASFPPSFSRRRGTAYARSLQMPGGVMRQ